MYLEVLDHATLIALNESSIKNGRSQNLRPDRLPTKPQERYWVNNHFVRDDKGQQEVRICVVFNLYTGQVAWLDVSFEEFAAIPLVDLPDSEWEAAMCAGHPPIIP